MDLLNTLWLGMPVWVWLTFFGAVLAILGPPQKTEKIVR